MPKLKVLFVGLNTVDIQFLVEGYPKANTKTKAKRNEIAVGGPATNAAIACAHLGAKTTLLTPIGKHSLTRFLSDDIVNYSVELIDPIEHIEAKPIFASIITNEINGERTIFSYHPEIDTNKLLKELNIKHLNEFDIAMFDGFYPDMAIPLAKHLNENGITTVLDGGSWKPGISELLSYIDIAICSNDFLPPDCNSSSDVINSLLKYGIKKIAITNGKNPIQYFNGNKIMQIKVPNIKAVDTLGAGDFYHGAFCYYFGNKPDFEGALKKASDIAALSCRHYGTRSWMKQPINN